MADPMALLVADAAAHAVEFVGLPEAQLNLAQAVVHLATAPKSNRVRARHLERPGGRAQRRRWRGAGAPARRQLPRRGDARPRRGLRVPSRRPPGLGRPAVPARRASAAACTTSRPTTASSRRCARRMEARSTRTKTEDAVSAGDLALVVATVLSRARLHGAGGRAGVRARGRCSDLRGAVDELTAETEPLLAELRRSPSTRRAATSSGSTRCSARPRRSRRRSRARRGWPASRSRRR